MTVTLNVTELEDCEAEKEYGYFGDDFPTDDLVTLDDLKKEGEEFNASLELYHNADPYMEISYTPVNTFSIYNDEGTLIEIDTDTGNVTFGEHFTMSETAKIFWECLGKSKDHPDPDALWDEYCNMKNAHVNFDDAMKVID